LVVENATRETFENINRAVALPAAPAPTAADSKPPQSITWRRPLESDFRNCKEGECQTSASLVTANFSR
jgi:hypothetical protein